MKISMRLIALLLSSLLFACVTPPSGSSSSVEEVRANSIDDLKKERAFDLIIEETRREGGVTYDVSHLKIVSMGENAYAVSLKGGELLPADASPEEIEGSLQKILLEHPDDFWKKGYALGTWIDQERGKLAIDRTVLITFSDEDREKALQKALSLAKEEGQKAIFDLSLGETIAVP